MKQPWKISVLFFLTANEFWCPIVFFFLENESISGAPGVVFQKNKRTSGPPNVIFFLKGERNNFGVS